MSDESRLPAPEEIQGIEGDAPANPDATIDIEIRQKEQDLEARKTYTVSILWMVVLWLTAMLGLVFLQGVHAPWLEGFASFSLESSVLIALITTTTASVVGILIVVVRNLFPTHPHKEEPKTGKRSEDGN